MTANIHLCCTPIPAWTEEKQDSVTWESDLGEVSSVLTARRPHDDDDDDFSYAIVNSEPILATDAPTALTIFSALADSARYFLSALYFLRAASSCA